MPLTTEPSICIPRTLDNVNWRDIKDTFEKLFGKGTVDRVDIVSDKRNNSSFCRIFVHMRYWPMNNPEAVEFRQKLMDGQTVQVVYDNPWFWKCAKSRAARPERKTAKTEPFIKFGDSSQAPSAPGAASNAALAATQRIPPPPLPSGWQAVPGKEQGASDEPPLATDEERRRAEREAQLVREEEEEQGATDEE